MFFSGFYIVVLVPARQRGVPAGQIGIMAAMLGVGGLAGALAAPYLTRRLSPYASMVSVFWVLTALTPLAAFVHNVLLTPDELRGRLTAVLGVAMGIAATIGAALGGLLVEWVPGATAVAVCAAGIAVVTVATTLSPTLRVVRSAAE